MDAITDFTRDILVSVRPHFVSKILSGEKTVELRRKFPEAGTAGALALLYSSSPISAIVGYARIKHVLKLPLSTIWKEYGAASCISRADFHAYFADLKSGFAILLDGVHEFRRPIKAADLRLQFGVVPPQSYRYLSGELVASLSDGQFQATGRHKRFDRTRGRTARSGASR
jgi:predicted transcriptional regulator